MVTPGTDPATRRNSEPFAARKSARTAALRPPLLLQNFEPAAETDAEAWLLACMMLFPVECARWAHEMDPGDFYRPHHQAIFGLLRGLVRAGGEINAVTALAACRAEGAADACGGAEYVRTLFLLDAHQPSAPSFAALVREAAARRRIAEGAVAVLEAAHDGASAEQLAETAEALVTNAPLTPDGSSQSARDIIRVLTDKLEAQQDNPVSMLGLTTGFAGIDRITNGLQAPDLIVLGARPGVGKSALMTGIAAHNAVKGEPVLIFSMEMSNEQTLRRMICAEAKLSAHKLLAGRLTYDEYCAYADASSALYDAPLVINERSGVTPSYMRGEVRKFIRRYGRVALVCVDYLQLMRPDGKTGDRYQELTEVSIELKGLAREFNVPLLALSQLSRESVKRENKRPALNDIRETGQIEQDADIVCFLYREDMFGQKDAPDPDAPASAVPAELLFRKHRNGPQGTVMLDFVEQFAVFTDPIDMAGLPAGLQGTGF